MFSKVVVVAACSAAGLMVLAGANNVQPSNDERITDLEFAVEALNARLSELEYVAKEAIEEHGRDFKNVADDAPESAPNGRYLVVDSIAVSDHQVDYSEEIERLQREVLSLEQTVMNEERTLSSISGETSGSRGDGGSSRKTARYNAQQNIVKNYRRTMQNKEKEMARLEAAQNEQKQIVHGRAGEVVITLITKSDMAKELSEISIDDYVTWSGKRVTMDRGSETWEVTRVTRID